MNKKQLEEKLRDLKRVPYCDATAIADLAECILNINERLRELERREDVIMVRRR